MGLEIAAAVDPTSLFQAAMDIYPDEPVAFLSEGDSALISVGVLDGKWLCPGDDLLDAMTDVSRVLPSHPMMRAMLFSPFDDKATRSALWAPLASGLIFVPKAQFRIARGRLTFACADAVRCAEALLERAAACHGSHAGEVTSTVDAKEEAYLIAVKRALTEIERGTLTKVVLARSTHVVRNAPFHIGKLLSALESAEVVRFALSHLGTTFVGATPETLVKVDGETGYTEAVAGTRPCGDRRWPTGPKEDREHEVVVRTIEERMASRGVHVSVGVRTIRRAGEVEHLVTPMRFRRRACADDHVVALAVALAPTPAVCGSPTLEALRFLRQHEPCDRGLYAGSVGWFNAEGDGHISVALRCALVQNNEAHLFSGAGIVAGSDPQHELTETELKQQTVRRALEAA